MKKRILSLLLAVITIFQMFPVFALPTIAEDEVTGIDVADMEVGKLYTAEFISDVFIPNGRYPFIDSGILDRSQLPRELTVARKSADDYDLVYVTENTANWPSEYTEYRYVTANKLSIAGGISVDSMEIGQIYTASWNTTDTGAYLYKKIPASESDIFVEYGYNSDQYVDPVVSTDGCPTELIVCLEKENDPYVRVTNEDWPEKYAQYRYLDPEYDIVILGEYVAPPADDGLIYGQVGLVMDGQTVETLTIAKGEKTYVFTELGSVIQGTPTYRWQLLIDRENNRWANIQDYVYPYAPISEALIANAGLDGAATLRCIATQDGVSYASGELDISVDPSLPAPELPLIPEPETEVETEESTEPESQNTDSLAVPAGRMMRSGNARASEEAFQIVVNYEIRHATALEPIDGTTAAGAHTVTRPVGGSYTGSVPSPPVAGYLPYVLAEHVSYIEGEKPDPITYDGEEYYLAASIHFDAVISDTTVNVYFIPQPVNFLVKIYEQNLHNDEYVLAGTVIESGLADAKVGEGLDTVRTGFSALYYDPNVPISDDGTGEVEIYYDRNYYLVKFELDSDEAYGATPYYVRYGSQVMLPTPTRPGYDFTGWTLTSVTDDDKQMVTGTTYPTSSNGGALITVQHNLEYEAGWDVATTTYTVIYWLENADDDGFTLDSFKVVDSTPNATVSAQDDLVRADKACFTFNANRSDKNIIVKGDGTTAVNVYYNRNYINLIFKGTGNCAYTHTHGDGTCVSNLICGIENTHVHDASCGTGILSCTIEEHVHSESCKTNCTLDEHASHTLACLTCTIDSHNAHTADCYEGAGQESDYSYWVEGTETEGSIGRIRAWGTSYYIYINGTWHDYDGNVTYGDKADPIENCQLTHGHIASCYKDVLHTHSSSCCGKPEHTHDSNKCYLYDCGVIQHEHTDECYGECTKFVHTHNNAANCSSKYVKVVTKKYDSYIADIWPIVDNNGYEYKDSGWWQSSITSKYYTILHKMPNQDITMTFSSTSGNTYTWYYAFEKLPGATYDGKDSVTSNGVDYFVDFSASVKGNNISLTYDEDYFPITGFTQRDSAVPNFNSRRAYLYYTRNSYKLTFHNGVNEITDKTESILFEADISGKYFVPDIPASKEPGSVKFAGWYTTKTYADGTEFDFTGQIMPARDLTLYAKWEDCSYTAKVYLDSKKETMLGYQQTVLFGSPIKEPNYKDAQANNPAYTKLIFAGWYYKDGSEEKRFDFNTMVLKQDLEIYAKWTSKVPVPYTVYYAIKNTDGSYTQIADTTKGMSLAGISKSFTAKVGTDLDEDYRTGYFPANRSHSMHMSNTEANEYTFVYSASSEVRYSVVHQFVNDEFVSIIGVNTITLTLETTITSTTNQAAFVSLSFRDGVTRAAIVSATGKSLTESQKDDLWTIVTNMSPDCYQQDLILTTNTEENVAYFNWMDREAVSIYQVIHKFQSLNDPDTYVAELPMEFVGNIDATATATAVERYGFTCQTKSVSGKITKVEYKNGAWTGGLVLELYYDRVKYEYTVHHYKIGTTTSIPGYPDDTFTDSFGTIVKVSEKAKSIDGYTLANGDTTVEISKEGQEIICYYQGLEVLYYYKISGSTLGGYLDPDNAISTIDATPPPSTLTLLPGYTLKEWYYTVGDSTEKIVVPDTWLSGDRMTVSPASAPAEWAGKAINIYAEVQPTSLTITSTITPGTTMPPDWLTSDQSFIYKIEGNGVSLTVAVPEGTKKTIRGLPTGNYTITVQSSWSWRYGEATREITFNGNQTEVFTFTPPGKDPEKDSGYYITDEAHN